jgi:epoxide hydrolase-like predicted phosphatase
VEGFLHEVSTNEDLDKEGLIGQFACRRVFGGRLPSDILDRMTIKAIIFDLGGVLLRTVDFSLRERLAVCLHMNHYELEQIIFGGESGDRAQRGEITVQQHWENLRQQINFSPEEFKTLIDDFFACDEIDESLIEYVRILHKTYKTALLSNAWDDLRQVIAERWHFEDAFDTLIISAEVRLVKPDPRIFQLALDRLGVEANQAIFVDDMKRNVEGAKEAGLQAIQFQNPQQMRFDLTQLLNSH